MKTAAPGNDWSIVAQDSGGGPAFGLVIQNPALTTPPLTIEAVTGDVGIGTTTPTQKLDVAGQVHATGDICTDAGGGVCLSTSKPGIAFVKDVKSNGVHGGNCGTNVWTTRDLNNLTGNTSFISIISNQITLLPGTYIVESKAPSYFSGAHRSRLQNVTDGVTSLIGSSEFTTTLTGHTNHSFLMGEVTIVGITNFEVQHICQVGGSGPTFGTLGTATSRGIDEVYTQLKITKIN